MGEGLTATPSKKRKRILPGCKVLHQRGYSYPEVKTMPRYTLETIVVLLLVLWLLGWLIVPVAGNLVHLLLVLILVVILLRLLQGRPPLP